MSSRDVWLLVPSPHDQLTPSQLPKCTRCWACSAAQITSVLGGFLKIGTRHGQCMPLMWHVSVICFAIPVLLPGAIPGAIAATSSRCPSQRFVPLSSSDLVKTDVPLLWPSCFLFHRKTGQLSSLKLGVSCPQERPDTLSPGARQGADPASQVASPQLRFCTAWGLPPATMSPTPCFFVGLGFCTFSTVNRKLTRHIWKRILVLWLKAHESACT